VRQLARLAVFLAVAGCRPSARAAVDASPPDTVHEPAAPLPPPPNDAPRTPKDKPMKSYFTSWGSPARSSRVAVSRRSFASITRVADVTAAPVAVLVDEAGDHVALDLGEHYELRTAAGALAAHGDKARRAPIVLSATGAFVADRDVSFGGGKGLHRSLGAVAPRETDRGWAVQLGAADGIFVLQRGQMPFMRTAALPDGSTAEVTDATPVAIELSVGRFWGDDPAFYTKDRGAYFEGRGCGAIRGDGTVALALADRRFFVFDAAAPDQPAVMQPAVSAQLSFVPVDLSIVEGGYALLAAGASGTTTLHVLDQRGKEAWHVSVPFLVDAPPVDGGGGRIYLAGGGFAAAEAGKIVWSQPATRHVSATALADGTVLVTTGSELRATSRDGNIVQALRAADGEAFVTPPAVAGDGTVWAASAKHVYVAR
jgi:hypothetical protein